MNGRTAFDVKPISKNYYVYAILSKDGKRMIKIGMTTNLLERRGRYEEEYGLATWRFVVIVDLDNNTVEADDEF
eukprot:scaffold34639_cov206-Amphora_coffeaeformis.AAC.8